MNMKFKTIVTSLVFFVTLISSNAINSAESDTSMLIGAWKLYKDDDTPKKEMPHEIMNFWNDGKFCIERTHPYKGNYEIKSNSLILLVDLKDKMITVSRVFNLNKHVLEFKNKKVGWVYYKRINKTPMESCFG